VTIVSLNNIISGPPVFIIHGAGGGIGVFRKLGLEVKFPAYDVQDTPDAPISGSLCDLARFYLSKIKETQPHGPYRLCGHSFGEFRCPRNSHCSPYFSRVLHWRYISQTYFVKGSNIDRLVMLVSSPAHFLLPIVQQRIRKTIIDGRLQDEVRTNTCHMACLLVEF
jgi:pimeloyl-ACP methyl ester carboxylesterase